jgi:hypothetical protein
MPPEPRASELINPYAPPVAAVLPSGAGADPAPPGQLRIDGAFGRAFETMKQFLFRPFHIGKWFAFGFIAWLYDVGEGNGVPNLSGFNNLGGGGSGGTGGGSGEALPDMSEVIAWIREHATAVVAIVIATALVGAALTALFFWLGARGTMMTLRAVALGHARVGEHWRATREAAWSYFGFKMLLWVITVPMTLGLLVWAGLAVYPFLQSGSPKADELLYALVPPIIGIVVVVLISVPFAFLGRNVLAPMLLACGGGLRANWRRTVSVVTTSPGGVFLFMLVRMLIAFVQGIAEVLAIYCTCCIGWIPVLHQTICAPLNAFERAYTLRVLESLGPAYKLIVDPPEVQAPPNPYGPPGPAGPLPSPYGPPGPPPGYGPPGYQNR